MNEKGIAKGELDNILRSVPIEELIDKEGKQFQKRGLQFMVYNLEEELLSDSLLLKTPIVRRKSHCWLPTGNLERVDKIKRRDKPALRPIKITLTYTS